VLKGSGSGGGVSRTVHRDDLDAIGHDAFRRAGASEIFCTTSMPSETRPKTVYLPVNDG
jgi:hypothetical protein